VSTERAMIARLPGYAEALLLGRSSGGILLDAGCCCAPSYLCSDQVKETQSLLSQSGLMHEKQPRMVGP
jgi:hypothetical protein